MRRRFFVDQVRNGHAQLAGEDARHLTRVLRVAAGQRYEISDNAHAYLAEIETARKEQVVFRTIEKLAPEPERVRMTLCAALIKFDRFERIIEKAAELGAAEVLPVHCVRSERGLDRAAEKRLERWRRIALEASQQSRRTHLLEVREASAFEETLTMEAKYRYVLDEEAGGATLLAALPGERRSTDSVAILVGPEGGWTPEERGRFATTGWTRVTMGPLILRAETAAIAALAVVSNAWLLD